MKLLRLRGRGQPYYGWLAVAAGTLILAGAGGSRFSFGVFLRPLTEEFGWSRASLSGALAVAALATGMSRVFAGIVADRFDPRAVSLVGLVAGGAALVGLSQVQQLWHLYALFIAMAVGFTLSSPTTVTKMVSPWFQRRRSLALAIAHSGAAMGEMVLVPAAGLALVVWGWRSAYVALGVLLFILAPIVWRLLSNAPDSADPDEVGAADDQDGSPALSRTERALEGLSLRSTIRLPMFWRLTAGFFA